MGEFVMEKYYGGSFPGKELITQARSFCNAPGGPYLYDEALQSDLILIRAAEEKVAAGDFDGAGELLGKPAFAALSRKKPKDPVDDTLKEQVKSLRENAKDILNNQFGPGNWNKGPGSDFNKIVKWINRSGLFVWSLGNTDRLQADENGDYFIFLYSEGIMS